MFSPRDQLCFVFSSPRSGSTWLTRCLNHHPQLVGTELRLFGEFCELWRDPSGAQIPRQTLDHFVRYFINHFTTPLAGADRDRVALRQELLEQMIDTLVTFARATTGKPVCVDKITPYLGTASQVLQRIQDCIVSPRIIHLVRDGRDVLVSGAFDTRQRQGQPNAGSLFDPVLIDQWSQYWVEPQRAIWDRQESGLSIQRVRYEDMLVDTAAQLQVVFQFLQVDDDLKLCQQIAERESFQATTHRKAGQERSDAKARKGIAGDWKNYLQRADAIRFRDQCQHWLFQYGYVADRNWVQECPADSPS